jgi:hypothetical protein
MEYNKLKIIQRPGNELQDHEVQQISQSLLREFNFVFPPKETYNNTIFFLLKDENKILSMGGLMNVEPVLFNNNNYSLLGFVEVVANIKGKGYGKRVITAMRDYLVAYNKSGIGFTKSKNIGFYEACGLSVDANSTQRFVYIEGDKRIKDIEDQVVFYHDSEDKFMKNVIDHPGLEIILPTAGLW